MRNRIKSFKMLLSALYSWIGKGYAQELSLPCTTFSSFSGMSYLFFFLFMHTAPAAASASPAART